MEWYEVHYTTAGNFERNAHISDPNNNTVCSGYGFRIDRLDTAPTYQRDLRNTVVKIKGELFISAEIINTALGLDTSYLTGRYANLGTRRKMWSFNTVSLEFADRNQYPARNATSKQVQQRNNELFRALSSL